MSRSKLPPYTRKRSCIANLYNKQISVQSTTSSSSLVMSSVIPEKFAADLPKGMIPLENQVAGHTFQTGTDVLGLLKDQHDGSILKPATKLLCGVREIKFYENLENTNDPCLSVLKKLVPEYRGTIRMHMGGRDIDFIKLTDLTHEMLEPCIMDVKIGRRTWDPLASEEKRISEEQKYLACKEKLGLCIPGFQVYSLTTGRLKKYDKDYGKKLNENTIKDALRIFLNADAGLSRALIMHFLSALWSIQKWARTQKLIKLYSSSLLLVYDARRLRSTLQLNKKNWNNSTNGITSITPTASPNTLTPSSGESNGGRLSPFNFPVQTDSTVQSYRKVQRSHSMQNNYDNDLKSIREEYVYMLDNLVGKNDSKEWAFIKLIDFAHVFPSENEIDTNYLFGIDSLVKMFEDFLKETE